MKGGWKEGFLWRKIESHFDFLLLLSFFFFSLLLLLQIFSLSSASFSSFTMTKKNARPVVASKRNESSSSSSSSSSQSAHSKTNEREAKQGLTLLKQFLLRKIITCSSSLVVLKKGREKQQWAVESRELVKFGQQLDLLGLVLKDVKGDGNCLFRCVIAALC